MRRPAAAAGWLGAPLGVLLCLALLLVAVPAHARGEVGPDNRIGRDTCTLLGRAWVDGRPTGCSRTRCIAAADFIRAAPNAEVCARGGEAGPRYGTFVDSRRCGLLHRTWVSVVNVCVSNPRRSLGVVAAGPGCVAPYTTYVTHSERDGDEDECLRPGRVVALQKIASRTGQTLRQVSALRSRTLCSFRPDTVFRNGVCRTSPVGGDRSGTSGTLVVGDSVTWRGTDELEALRPDWTVDGLPGRKVADLRDRVATYLRGHTAPETVVVALGTNPTYGWTRADYVGALAALPKATRVVYVTPFRDRAHNNAAVATTVETYAGWMRAAADERPRSCVADWRAKVASSPGLLIDGTHQTTPGERVWARFIAQQTDRCVARYPVVTEDPADPEDPVDPGPVDPGPGVTRGR